MKLVEVLAEEGEGEREVGGGQLGAVLPAVEHRGIGHVANGEMRLAVWDDLHQMIFNLNYANFLQNLFAVIIRCYDNVQMWQFVLQIPSS